MLNSTKLISMMSSINHACLQVVLSVTKVTCDITSGISFLETNAKQHNSGMETTKPYMYIGNERVVWLCMCALVL